MKQKKRTRKGKPIQHGTSWRIRWRDEHGLRRSEVYDSYEDALFSLQRHYLKLEEIERGLRSPSAPRRTFSDLCDYYLKYVTPEKRRQRDDISIIGKHLRPFFGEFDLGHVENRIDYFKVTGGRDKLSRKTVHNILTLLISMMRVAYEKRWLLEKPRIKKPRLIENEYRYLKTEDEIKKFLIVAKDQNERAWFLYLTAIYTGMRQGELAGLKWKHIDLERRLIHVCHSYKGPTKSGKGRFVPIVDILLPILKEWKLKRGGSLVFTNAHGKMFQESSRGFHVLFLTRLVVIHCFPLRNEKSGIN